MISADRLLFAAALCLALGCGEPAGAPRLVLAHGWDPFDDSVGLAWMHPPGEASGGFALEVRAFPDTYTDVVAVAAPQLSLEYRFAAEAPEATGFEFRLRALPDGQGTRVSEAVTVQRGLRRPVLECVHGTTNACLLVNGGFQLSWSNVSAKADALLLERLILQGSDVIRTTLPVTVGSTGYSDTDVSLWVDCAQFQYSLTAISGSVRSLRSIVVTRNAPPCS
jgi:hypothetical protein